MLDEEWMRLGHWLGSVLCQGSHSPGKPGKLLEYCKPGKLLEFYVRPGIFGISRFTHIKAKYSAYIFTTYFLQQVLTLIAFNYVW